MIENFNIDELIKKKTVGISFLPIVSIKRRSVIGLEAVPHGIAPDGETVPAAVLTTLAKTRGLSLDLDRMFRQSALESFQPIHSAHPEYLLFLNFDTSIVDLGVVGSGHLREQVKSLGLDPNSLVIQITESHAKNLTGLKTFIDTHRERGFLIALDELGSGHSNLDRISLTRPDVLKVAGSLVEGIGKEYYKQEILRSLINLSKKLGALVVAKDVRREEEAILSLELGVDMLQGSIFPWPAPGPTDEATTALADKFRDHLVRKTNASKGRNKQYDEILGLMLKELSSRSLPEFDGILQEFAGRHGSVECIYLLDGKGTQVSPTFTRPGKTLKHNSLFRPAQEGADHSYKDYFYLLMDTFVSRFTTEPYVSLATGSLCITLSGMFRDASQQPFILCVDVPLET
ncbi:MAG: EAL domain-containing protein [Elusimicrobia bacterium]|nr:EAL domain-containing protein [Elusimicrobiota bacterium]